MVRGTEKREHKYIHRYCQTHVYILTIIRSIEGRFSKCIAHPVNRFLVNFFYWKTTVLHTWRGWKENPNFCCRHSPVQCFGPGFIWIPILIQIFFKIQIRIQALLIRIQSGFFKQKFEKSIYSWNQFWLTTKPLHRISKLQEKLQPSTDSKTWNFWSGFRFKIWIHWPNWIRIRNTGLVR